MTPSRDYNYQSEGCAQYPIWKCVTVLSNCTVIIHDLSFSTSIKLNKDFLCSQKIYKNIFINFQKTYILQLYKLILNQEVECRIIIIIPSNPNYLQDNSVILFRKRIKYASNLCTIIHTSAKFCWNVTF